MREMERRDMRISCRGGEVEEEELREQRQKSQNRLDRGFFNF